MISDGFCLHENLRFVSNDYDSKKDETDFTHWYVIHLWRKENDESYKDVWEYYIIDNELCYVKYDFGSEYFESGVNRELNIPVHYKPGDILMADAYPFGPKEKFIMLMLHLQEQEKAHVWLVMADWVNWLCKIRRKAQWEVPRKLNGGIMDLDK